MNDKSKSKWYWRLLRWGLIGLAVLITLAAVLVTEENWRGKRDWENYQRAAEARGEHLDLSAYEGTNIPDDQNFAKAPIFSGIYSQQWDEKSQEWKPNSTNSLDPLFLLRNHSNVDDPYGRGEWTRATLSHWDSWPDYYLTTNSKAADEFPGTPHLRSPAADALRSLGDYDAVIDGLRSALPRPYAQFGDFGSRGEDHSLMMEYLAAFKRFARILRPLAIAELAEGQSAQGLESELLVLRLDDKVRAQPFLIDHLVAIAINAIAIQPVYEGLTGHRWTDAQIMALEKELAAQDFLAEYQMAIHGEQAYGLQALENQRITKEYKIWVDSGSGKGKVGTVNLRLFPSAFFYRNELALVRFSDQFILPLVDVTNRVISPAAVGLTSAEIGRQLKHFSPYKFEGVGTLEGIVKVAKKFAIAQSSVDLARVACALERYRLAHGEYPETLDTLDPQYIDPLPHDIINGQPLHYRRTAGGNFILYSVGWNEKDDGGQIVLNKSGMVDRDQGDWVWNSAAK